MTRYPILPDEDIITDWYAGASLTQRAVALVDAIDGWDAGDAVVAFSDIGPHASDQPSHGQIVVYVQSHLGATLRACSAEIDPDDALKIAKHLTRWAKKAKEEA